MNQFGSVMRYVSVYIFLAVFEDIIVLVIFDLCNKSSMWYCTSYWIACESNMLCLRVSTHEILSLQHMYAIEKSILLLSLYFLWKRNNIIIIITCYCLWTRNISHKVHLDTNSGLRSVKYCMAKIFVIVEAKRIVRCTNVEIAKCESFLIKNCSKFCNQKSKINNNNKSK